MNTGLAFTGGVALGAGLMYLLDPRRGKRRRALIHDQAVHRVHITGNTANRSTRHLMNRAQGLGAATHTRLLRDHAGDDVVVARVRAALGRAVSHPHAIQVTARAGHVMLSGDIQAHEAPRLLKQVSRVRGVMSVEDQLQVHEQAE
jgi:hypothetical protein